MKKLAKLFYIIILLLFVSSCSKGNNLSNKDYNFVIFDNSNVYIFKEENNELKEIDKFSRIGEKANHWKMNFVKDGDYIYTRTVESDPWNSAYLTKIDLSTYKEENAKFEYPNALGVGKDYVYGASVRGLQTVFTKFDKNNLKFLMDKTISDNQYLKMVRDILEINNELYVLVGEVDLKTSTNNNVIWKMDKDFNILEKINLGYVNSGFLEMELVKDKLYIIEGTRGRNVDGEPGGGDKIIVYNINSRQIDEIKLSTKYPLNIRYDEYNNNLLIEHYGNYMKDFPITVYSLNSEEEKVFTIEEFRGKGSEIPSYDIDKDNYYFLLDNKVIKYNLKSGEKTSLMLGNFKLNKPHSLIVKKQIKI